MSMNCFSLLYYINHIFFLTGSFRKRQQEKTVNFIKDACNILCQNDNFVMLASRKFKFRNLSSEK